MPLNHDPIIESLTWRYATKQFDPTKSIAQKDWSLLEETLRLSPSSFGLQPWKFLFIKNQEVKKQLRPASWNQSQIQDCSLLVVFTSLKKVTTQYIDKYLQSIASTRQMGIENLEDYRKMMINYLVKDENHENKDKHKDEHSSDALHWSQLQAYIAIGNLLTSAALLKIDACPIGGINPEQYDEILDLTDSDYATAAVVALGYRHPDDKYQHLAKVRFPKDDVIKVI